MENQNQMGIPNRLSSKAATSMHKLNRQMEAIEKFVENATLWQLNAKTTWFNCQTFSAIAKPISIAIARPDWLVAQAAAAARRWFRHYNLKLPNANDNAYQSQHTHKLSKRWDWPTAVLRGVAQWDAQWDRQAGRWAVEQLLCPVCCKWTRNIVTRLCT